MTCSYPTGISLPVFDRNSCPYFDLSYRKFIFLLQRWDTVELVTIVVTVVLKLIRYMNIHII